MGPGQHRLALWRFCTGASQTSHNRFTLQVHDLLGEGDDWEDVEQIWLDVQRTPHITDEQRAMLVRILRVLCARQRFAADATSDHCGQYVQGMHLLACCPFWAGMPESDAFHVAEYALSHICAGYYTELSFETFRRDSWVMEALMKERFPLVLDLLHVEGVPTQVLTFSPLLCLFAHHAIPAVAVRLWDVLLVEGNNAIFAVFLAVLQRVFPDPNSSAGLESGAYAAISRYFGQLSVLDVEDVLALVQPMLDEFDDLCIVPRVTELRERGPEEPLVSQSGMITQLRDWWNAS